jgi:hypothetical protein
MLLSEAQTGHTAQSRLGMLSGPTVEGTDRGGQPTVEDTDRGGYRLQSWGERSAARNEL